jgi:membrane protein YqaA with SNARE-associated domain
VKDQVALAVVGFASALAPIVNIEAYLAVRAAVSEGGAVWVPAFVAALGQMVGKLVWYRVGASSLTWGWVRRRIEKPKAMARLQLWRARTQERPVPAGALVLVSAVCGLPPFAVLAVVAGQLRMPLPLFLGLGLAGRWLRFAAVLGGVGWLERSGLLW